MHFMNRKINFLWSLTILLMVVSCNPSKKAEQGASGELSGTISVSGAFALYPLVNVWAEDFRKEYPDVRFNISAGGAGKGMADVLGGAIDLGMFSREIMDSEKAQGVWWVAVTKDAVIPTISASNPILGELKQKGMTRAELAGLFLTNDRHQWKSSEHQVSVFTRSDASGAAATWGQYLGAPGQEELRGIAVYGDPGLAEAVRNDPFAIGYNNVIYVYDLNSGLKYPGMEVVPIDLNENGQVDPEEDFYNNLQEITTAIADGRYPSPPARELYLIANGKPQNPAVIAFLNYVLAKGQAHVEANGYIKLSAEVTAKQKTKLTGE